MSAGTKIVQLRDALIQLLPYATAHARHCQRHPCTCNLERAVQVARQLTTVDPARTGGPDRQRPKPPVRSSFGVLALCVLLAGHVSAQSTADRARARGDSLLAVAKCWRWAKTPDVRVPISDCPDSTEAVTTMLPHAPVMHLDRRGAVHFHMATGQTLQLRATLLRGFLFIWPAGVPFRGASIPSFPVAPPDAVRRVI